MNSMKKIYIIKEVCDQSEFSDHYGETAAPSVDIIMAFTDFRTMIKSLKDLIRSNTQSNVSFYYEIINLNEEVSTENTWISVDLGFYPEEDVPVSITYIGYISNKPMCGEAAYYHEGKWYWRMDDSEVRVRVIAWKELDEPYDPKEDNE